jgi:uncharacterized membrane protein YwaF
MPSTAADENFQLLQRFEMDTLLCMCLAPPMYFLVRIDTWVKIAFFVVAILQIQVGTDLCESATDQISWWQLREIWPLKISDGLIDERYNAVLGDFAASCIGVNASQDIEGV